MSDRIAVMTQGRIEQLDTPDAIYERPSSVFVAGFIGTANLLPAKVVDIRDDHIVSHLAAGPTITEPSGGRAFSAGMASTVMVRPERIELSPTEPNVPGRLQAVVTESIFQGASSKIIVRTNSGGPATELIAHVETERGPAPRPGDHVWVSWQPGAAFVLPEATNIVGATTTDVDEVEAAL